MAVLRKLYRIFTTMNTVLPPLPERMRPHKLSEYVGQSHLVGEGGVLKNMMDSGNVTSFILWGPPGVGKTTLAKILAESLHRDFYTLSAVSSGVKDVRDVIDRAQSRSVFSGGEPPILFIDEIHRFNKAQQDALLGAVEQGIFTLIGATTENPSFEVITPLLSRCQVFVLKSLEESDLKALLNRALTEDVLLKERQISVSQTDALFRYSGGVSGMESLLTGVYDSQFKDSGDIAPALKPGVYWAVYQGVVGGVTQDTLAPRSTATRAQIAVILVRFAEKM